ncbi:MAG: hypothetical protein P3M73_00210 [Candidatus Hodgkinia cicadicola]|nr:MAG: hypothetical protein P3M73_00210 [Candidatus Hodgkinia cicadicola]
MLDTETTGLNTKIGQNSGAGNNGTKNGKATNQAYRSHLIHIPTRLANQLLQSTAFRTSIGSQPKFQEEAQRILQFVRQRSLFASNSKFDLEVVSTMLVLIGLATIEQSKWYDALKFAHWFCVSGSNSLRRLANALKQKLTQQNERKLTVRR